MRGRRSTDGTGGELVGRSTKEGEFFERESFIPQSSSKCLIGSSTQVELYLLQKLAHWPQKIQLRSCLDSE